MLVTATGKKAVGRGKGRFSEDEITSIVFSPILMMNDTRLTWAFWKEVVEGTGKTWPYVWIPESMKIEFWPKMQTLGGRLVEPDLLFSFLGPDELCLNIIVEIKWDSGLSSPDQLVKQWFHKEDVRGECLHFYLTKSATKGLQSINDSIEYAESVPDGLNVDEWKDKLLALTWGNVHQAASHFSKDSIWAEAILIFLEKQGISSFTGFDWVKSLNCPFNVEESSFFSLTPWFDFELGLLPDEDNGNLYKSN